MHPTPIGRARSSHVRALPTCTLSTCSPSMFTHSVHSLHVHSLHLLSLHVYPLHVHSLHVHSLDVLTLDVHTLSCRPSSAIAFEMHTPPRLQAPGPGCCSPGLAVWILEELPTPQ